MNGLNAAASRAGSGAGALTVQAKGHPRVGTPTPVGHEGNSPPARTLVGEVWKSPVFSPVAGA